MALNTPFNSSETGGNFQPLSAVLTATTAAFTTESQTKLNSLAVSSNHFDFGSMRMQWGTAAVTLDGGQTVTLPLAFANSAYVLSLSVDNGWTTVDTAIVPFRWTNKTPTTFIIDRDDDVTGTALVDWIAIGVVP